MKLVHSTQPLVITVDDALSQAECDNILSSNIDFNPSLGFDYGKNRSLTSNYRSSYTAHDFRGEFSFLRDRAVSLCQHYFPQSNILFDNTEIVQLTRYGVGQEYKKHVDYFNNPNTHAMDNDRCATVIFYLNDDFDGGETHFPHLDITIKPKKGLALFFAYNYDFRVNHQTTHAGLPVIAGVKTIATIWVHSEPYNGSQPVVQ